MTYTLYLLLSETYCKGQYFVWTSARGCCCPAVFFCSTLAFEHHTAAQCNTLAHLNVVHHFPSLGGVDVVWPRSRITLWRGISYVGGRHARGWLLPSSKMKTGQFSWIRVAKLYFTPMPTYIKFFWDSSGEGKKNIESALEMKIKEQPVEQS